MGVEAVCVEQQDLRKFAASHLHRAPLEEFQDRFEVGRIGLHDPLRHGVIASHRVPAECGNAAAQLDRIASEVGAGLVIAGAYGHSRFREWVFGGVTKRLLTPSSRCSLLSR